MIDTNDDSVAENFPISTKAVTGLRSTRSRATEATTMANTSAVTGANSRSPAVLHFM